MLTMKFLDGTPVDAGYQAQISRLVSQAAEAIEAFGEDELERYAAARPDQHPFIVAGESVIRDWDSGEPMAAGYHGRVWCYSDGRRSLFETGIEDSGERYWNCIQADA
ncbi:hypothetical protein QU487_06215 [Crenobacter sp. SG2305]|uniref:hypothetical protein n=1 Tax=Crenobacter oryzisoli TaxID=3056844 RepID=UPI0025AA8E9B|nr:hypothetical protein [Crenobacter sp. SG2305]MDN0082346.1 hypothetical protein [Crenobacter sp. SG2305]